MNGVGAITVLYDCGDGIIRTRHVQDLAPEYVVVSFVGKVGHNRVRPWYPTLAPPASRIASPVYRAAALAVLRRPPNQ
jgi:hypothetical protein